MKKTWCMAAALVLLAAAVPAAGWGAQGAEEGTTYTVEEMLEFAVQDEYRMQRLYGVLQPDNYWARSPHMDMLAVLCARYGVDVPADNPDAYELPQASDSAESVLQAIEDAQAESVGMYSRFLAEDLPADVRDVFWRLRSSGERQRAVLQRGGYGYGPAAGGGYYGRGRDFGAAAHHRNYRHDPRGNYWDDSRGGYYRHSPYHSGCGNCWR